MSEIDQTEGEARSYHRWQFRPGALGLLLTAGYLVALLGTGALGLSGPAEVAGLPLLGLVTMGVSLIALPVINGWSRRVETLVDDFALRLS